MQKGILGMELIQHLDAVSQKDVMRVGGKGANLGALLQAGFSVPAGFVVLTSAYQQFIQGNTLQETIEQLAAHATLDDLRSIENASSSICALFETGQMSGAFIVAVKAAYTHLGRGPVAVRSSATAEDLPEASFAGQQETYLNVQSENDVLIAIRQCWSSLWTARALAYRLRHSVAPHTVRLAVVVQQMVHADSAGVLFTINPMTDNANEMVINATWGLGEALVEGHVTPDMIIADKTTGEVKRLEEGSKEVTLGAAKHGIREHVTDVAQRQKTVLTHEQVAGLTQRGNQIEILFGTPQDQDIAQDGLVHISSQELHTRVAQRRIAYEYWLTVVAPDALGPDGTPLIEEKQATTMLEGVAASSGRVRGRARIIQNVQEVSRLTGEDILVTQATDPGWTPIFPLVQGIVLEVGGQLSHGSIVAREYGIPAVVNVQGALRLIQEGQFIIVDGTQGRVYLEEEKGYSL